MGLIFFKNQCLFRCFCLSEQEVFSSVWRGQHDGGGVPGRGAAAGEPPHALLHPGAQHLELHRGAAKSLV